MPLDRIVTIDETIPTPRLSFLPCVDSSILSAWHACRRKCYLQYFCHWRPKHESVHLIAGGAFAAGVEAARKAFYIDGADRFDAQAIGVATLIQHYGDFEPPFDSAKTCERMAGALEFYFDNYRLGSDSAVPMTIGDQKAIEFSFAIPLDFTSPLTGEPILYTGRADCIAEYAGGVYPVDEKTTSSLGKSWANQWELRSQFTGYCWSCKKELGITPKGALVRGISILKTKYDTQQTVTSRPEWEIERWYDQIHRDLLEMEECYRRGYWDYNLDGACNEYGGCQFRNICKMKDPLTWLKVDFEQKVWDPTAKTLRTVEEWENMWLV